MNAYEKRDLLLVELGYGNYSNYLGSELWKGIRTRVLRGKLKCFCLRKAGQIHHRNYSRKTLVGESLKDLVPLCGHCHKKIETDRDGAKRSLSGANRRLKELVEQQSKRVKKCARCGNKPMKMAAYCRPCIRFNRFGAEGFPSADLSICAGKDCTHQAAIGKRYCRIHEVQPELSLGEYRAFVKRARRIGVRL
jgi:hypothetical protein